MEVPPLLGHLQHHSKSVAGQERGRGGELLSAVELGATEERDFAPEGQRFFKILAEDSVPNFASSIDFHFYKRVEISGMIVVLLSM